MANHRFWDRARGRRDEREESWRGDPAFGDGWGNQVPRPQRLGDRGWRQSDDPYAEAERYGRGAPDGYGADEDFGPGYSDISYGGAGFDAGYGHPRFDQIDVGRVGSHGVRPVTSYRATSGFTSSARAQAIRDQRDPHYSAWRRRQIEALDRDYDDYLRENQSRFDREFGEWRSRRGLQREAVGRVTEHMEVLGSDGVHVGTVDKVRGDTIILTKNDPSAGGVHHAVPCGWVDRVEDKVTLTIPAEEAVQRWRTESRSRALFERPDSGQDGPHILNRSFSGTYRDDE